MIYHLTWWKPLCYRGYKPELWFPPDGICYWVQTKFMHYMIGTGHQTLHDFMTLFCNSNTWTTVCSIFCTNFRSKCDPFMISRNQEKFAVLIPGHENSNFTVVREVQNRDLQNISWSMEFFIVPSLLLLRMNNTATTGSSWSRIP